MNIVVEFIDHHYHYPYKIIIKAIEAAVVIVSLLKLIVTIMFSIVSVILVNIIIVNTITIVVASSSLSST